MSWKLSPPHPPICLGLLVVLGARGRSNDYLFNTPPAQACHPHLVPTESVGVDSSSSTKPIVAQVIVHTDQAVRLAPEKVADKQLVDQRKNVPLEKVPAEMFLAPSKQEQIIQHKRASHEIKTLPIFSLCPLVQLNAPGVAITSGSGPVENPMVADQLKAKSHGSGPAEKHHPENSRPK